MRKAPSAGIMTKKMIASILFLHPAGFKKNVFLEKRIFTFEHGAKVFCDSITSFLMLSKGALILEDSSDFDVVFFSHDMILIDFVVSVKLFSQVFCDLGRGGNFEMPHIAERHFVVVMDHGFIPFDAEDPIDFGSVCPELAFLWCFIFHG
jgi:hypothetical protein